MKDKIEILVWLSKWYASECNGDWEHEYGILIRTTDNPGWSITIDLNDTFLENTEIVNDVIEKAENDWHFFQIKDKKYRAASDLSKLSFLLLKFKELAENLKETL